MATGHKRELFSFVAVVLCATLAFEAWQQWQSWRQAQALATLVRAGDLRLISSQTCVYCTQARRWLQAKALPFSECFIEQDAACAATYRALHSPGTPLVMVRGEPQLGFDPERVRRALSAQPS
jgi:glutaredoxin